MGRGVNRSDRPLLGPSLSPFLSPAWVPASSPCGRSGAFSPGQTRLLDFGSAGCPCWSGLPGEVAGHLGQDVRVSFQLTETTSSFDSHLLSLRSQEAGPEGPEEHVSLWPWTVWAASAPLKHGPPPPWPSDCTPLPTDQLEGRLTPPGACWCAKPVWSLSLGASAFPSVNSLWFCPKLGGWPAASICLRFPWDTSLLSQGLLCQLPDGSGRL